MRNGSVFNKNHSPLHALFNIERIRQSAKAVHLNQITKLEIGNPSVKSFLIFNAGHYQTTQFRYFKWFFDILKTTAFAGFILDFRRTVSGHNNYFCGGIFFTDVYQQVKTGDFGHTNIRNNEVDGYLA